MKNTLNNACLKNDLKDILNNPNNVGSISKGDVSKCSIMISFKEPVSFVSYTYYEREAKRDSDYETLLQIIEDGNYSS